jgi:hypothetical protein
MYGYDLHTIRWYLTQERSIHVYGLGVGISTVFKIFGHFLCQGETGPLCMVMTYTPSAATLHKKQEYVLFRGRDLNGF